MSEPLSGSGTAVALGGATVFGLFTERISGLCLVRSPGVICGNDAAEDFSLACGGTFSGVVHCWCAGGACAVSLIASKTGYDGTSADALCAVLVAVVSVKILSFIHQQDIASLVSGLFSRLRGGGGDNVK